MRTLLQNIVRGLGVAHGSDRDSLTSLGYGNAYGMSYGT